jgi:hypothetical protein
MNLSEFALLGQAIVASQRMVCYAGFNGFKNRQYPCAALGLSFSLSAWPSPSPPSMTNRLID